MRSFLFVLAMACGSESAPQTEVVDSLEAAEEVVEIAVEEPQEPTPTAPSSDDWSSILDEYVTDGGFRYSALHDDVADRTRLDAYIRAIGIARTEELPRDVALAFYINAYNALTVRSVIELWPLQSVMDEEGFFDARLHQVAGRELTLNQLENDIIRSERFAEPRIHFAVNCASVGCPPLQREAFTATNLEANLASAARAFVRSTTRADAEGVHLSQLFEWFQADFERVGGVRAFVASQLDPPNSALLQNESTTLSYTPYDWALNTHD